MSTIPPIDSYGQAQADPTSEVPLKGYYGGKPKRITVEFDDHSSQHIGNADGSVDLIFAKLEKLYTSPDSIKGDASARKDEERCSSSVAESPAKLHFSDCASYNEPAMPNGECDCGGAVEDITAIPMTIIHHEAKEGAACPSVFSSEISVGFEKFREEKGIWMLANQRLALDADFTEQAERFAWNKVRKPEPVLVCHKCDDTGRITTESVQCDCKAAGVDHGE